MLIAIFLNKTGIMAIEIITKEDLHLFRVQLLDDIRQLLQGEQKEKKREWLRSADVRKLLKISAGTLQNLRISGALQPTKIGGSFFYNYQELLDLLASNNTKKKAGR